MVVARAQSRRANASGAINAATIDSAAFMASLIAHVQTLEVETEEALVRVGMRVQSTARGLAPVDTGRLRSSIVMVKGRDGAGFYVAIGTNVSYARFVEFGTSRTRAQPFLTPALALATGMIAQEVS